MSCLGALPAQAEEAAAGNELEEIVVTASRLGSQIMDLPTSVSVVPEAELQAQFNLAADVLKALDIAVPGMSVSRGVRGGCDSNIRGRPASYQINGVPINQDLRASNCNAMYQVSPYSLERVEVVRGATAVYGAGAPGGIVNLITRRARSEKLEIDGVFLGSGDPGHIDATAAIDVYAGLGQQVGNWDWYGGVAYNDTNAARSPDDEYVPREEFHNWALNGSVGRDFGDAGRLRVTGTFYHEERGREYAADFDRVDADGIPVITPIDDNPFKDDDHYDQLFSVMASYDNDEFFGHKLALSAYVQEQTYIQRANFFFSSSFGDDLFNSDTENDHWGVRSTLARSFDVGGNELGLEYGFDFGRAYFFRPQIDLADGETVVGFVAPEVTFDTYSFFTQAHYDVGDFGLVGGVRYELYRGEVGDEDYVFGLPGAAVPGDFDHSDLVMFNVGATYDIVPELQFYGGFSQGAELSQVGRAARNINDPGRITPEPATSNQVEGGLRGSSGSFEYTAAGFYSWSNKASLLQADPSCAGQGFCPLIPLRAKQRFWGAEATLDWVVNEQVTTGALFTWQRGEIYDDGFGEYIEFSTETLSPLRLTGYVEFELVEGWETRLQGTWFGAADYYTPAEVGLGFVNTDSLFLADLTSSYKIGPGQVTLGVSNLLDNEYINASNQASGAGSVFYHYEEGLRLSLGYRLRY